MMFEIKANHLVAYRRKPKRSWERLFACVLYMCEVVYWVGGPVQGGRKLTMK